jgi:16S rRNA (cytosine1402-N4)-methyltransferase
VLLHEVVQYLAVRRGGVYVDCTLGEGGHALAILRAAMPGGKLLGIDLDPIAREHALRRLAPYEGAFVLAGGNYSRIRELAVSLGYGAPDGILMDLGLSSLQLEASGRGFSFRRDEPLDMRFDPEAPLTAAQIVNTFSSEELAGLLFRYGEEPRARTIARAIVERRPLRTTADLAGLVVEVKGRTGGRIHPATRTFQALRIAVNSELENLRAGLQQAMGLLKPGGRIVVIAYHSLEDRIVKEAFALESRACICPPEVPVCTCGHVPSLRLITRRVVTPSAREVMENPRSRSARLRAAERL